MKIYKLVLLSFFLVGCAATQEKLNQDYDWSESPNYSELRKTIGWSDGYNAKCMFGRPLAEMAVAMNSEKWDEAVVIGNSWLNQCPIDIRAHYYMGVSQQQLGNEIDSKNHFRWVSGFMDDLVASGDGKTPETAYEVISISEEYDAIYLFGLEKKSQSLISAEIMCDLITAVNENGEEVSIYFNPAAHFARLSKMLD